MIKNPGYLNELESQSNVLGCPEPPQFILLREEWVSLTGDLVRACILEKMVYWGRQTKDVALYVKEEINNSSCAEPSFQYGWFYKPFQDLMEGTMLRVTAATFRRYLHFLMDRGWIQRRIVGVHQWSRQSFYRVNLRKLHADLQKKGYAFPDFTLYDKFSHSSKDCGDPSNLNASMNTEGNDNSWRDL